MCAWPKGPSKGPSRCETSFGCYRISLNLLNQTCQTTPWQRGVDLSINLSGVLLWPIASSSCGVAREKGLFGRCFDNYTDTRCLFPENSGASWFLLKVFAESCCIKSAVKKVDKDIVVYTKDKIFETSRCLAYNNKIVVEPNFLCSGDNISNMI